MFYVAKSGMNTLSKLLLTLTAAAALSFAHPVTADTITTFNVSGTCTPVEPGLTGTTFGGNITIDVTAGTVTAIDVSFQDLTPFNTISVSLPSGTSDWVVEAFNSGDLGLLSLTFTTGHTPASLVGFTGGTIDGVNVTFLGNLAYRNLNGSVTAAGVP